MSSAAFSLCTAFSFASHQKSLVFPCLFSTIFGINIKYGGHQNPVIPWIGEWHWTLNSAPFELFFLFDHQVLSSCTMFGRHKELLKTNPFHILSSINAAQKQGFRQGAKLELLLLMESSDSSQNHANTPIINCRGILVETVLSISVPRSLLHSRGVIFSSFFSLSVNFYCFLDWECTLC